MNIVGMDGGFVSCYPSPGADAGATCPVMQHCQLRMCGLCIFTIDSHLMSNIGPTTREAGHDDVALSEKAMDGSMRALQNNWFCKRRPVSKT
jgi:hypothetical protein